MVERLKEMRKGRRERGSRERIEIERKEKETEEHHHLPVLVVQSTAVVLRRHKFPTRFFSKAL